MQTLNYWKQFEHTGKVEDYLSYATMQHKESRAKVKEIEENVGEKTICSSSHGSQEWY